MTDAPSLREQPGMTIEENRDSLASSLSMMSEVELDSLVSTDFKKSVTDAMDIDEHDPASMTGLMVHLHEKKSANEQGVLVPPTFFSQGSTFLTATPKREPRRLISSDGFVVGQTKQLGVPPFSTPPTPQRPTPTQFAGLVIPPQPTPPPISNPSPIFVPNPNSYYQPPVTRPAFAHDTERSYSPPLPVEGGYTLPPTPERPSRYLTSTAPRHSTGCEPPTCELKYVHNCADE